MPEARPIDPYIKYFTSRKFTRKFPKYALLARIIKRCKIEESTSFPWAAVRLTKGKYHLQYNPLWMADGETDPIEVLWVLAHEALHITQKDISRFLNEYGDEPEERLNFLGKINNFASDMVNNTIIANDFPGWKEWDICFPENYDLSPDRSYSSYMEYLKPLHGDVQSAMLLWADEAEDYVDAKDHPPAFVSQYVDLEEWAEQMKEMMDKLKGIEEGEFEPVSQEEIEENINPYAYENREGIGQKEHPEVEKVFEKRKERIERRQDSDIDEDDEDGEFELKIGEDLTFEDAEDGIFNMIMESIREQLWRDKHKCGFDPTSIDCDIPENNPFLEGDANKEIMSNAEIVAYDMAKDFYQNPNNWGNIARECDESGFAEEVYKERAQKEANKIIQDAIESQDEVGKVPGMFDKYYDLEEEGPKASWKELLRRYISSMITNEIKSNFQYPRKNQYRYFKRENGEFVPTTENPEPVYPHYEYQNSITIMYAVDTSGSISDKEFEEALSELQKMLQAFSNIRVLVAQADVPIQDVQLLEGESDINEYIEEGIRRGCGGTSFKGPFNLAEWINGNERELDYVVGEDEWAETYEYDNKEQLFKYKQEVHSVDVMVYHTDGYCQIPTDETSFDLIWCLTSEHSEPPVTAEGETIGYVVSGEVMD